MLAVSYEDVMLWGCPNCGCDMILSDGLYGFGTSFVKCENCKLDFIILGKDIKESSFGIPIDNGKHIEYPRLIEHPRKGVNKWKYELPDIRPEGDGEYFSSRGIGYDLAGFVKSKKAGERLIEMVKKVLGLEKPKTWLDYREYEPKWIQVKFQKEEFDLEELDKLVCDGIITEEKLMKCRR